MVYYAVLPPCDTCILNANIVKVYPYIFALFLLWCLVRFVCTLESLRMDFPNGDNFRHL